jgi:hypothetical protein
VRTLADIEHGVRKASPATYAMLENKLAWAPGSIDTILAGGEPTELVSTLRRSNSNASSQGYALRPTNANDLSQVPTEELLLELRRRIIAPATGATTPGTTGAALTREATGPRRANGTDDIRRRGRSSRPQRQVNIQILCRGQST